MSVPPRAPGRDPSGGGPVFLRALRASALRPQGWVSSWLLLVLMALAASLPWLAFFDESLGGHYEPGAQVGSLTETFRFDHRDELGGLERSSAMVGAGLALLAMLSGAFCAGGWVQIFLERTKGRTLRRFFLGGARHFLRFTRLLLLTLLILGVIGFFVYGAPWTVLVEELLLGDDSGQLETLASERSAFWIQTVQHALFALGVALTMAWGDYTRARMALHDSTSSLWAGLCTLFVIAKHPLRTLRPMLALVVIEAVLLWFLGDMSSSANHGLAGEPSWRGVVALLGLGQLAALVRALVRGAHLFAAVDVSQHVVRPLSRPDPWGERVGGPGGPQYPLDEDEFGISL